MNFNSEFEYQRAWNFKMHQKKLAEIKRSPQKRIDNQLSSVFLTKKKTQGYKDLWWNYKINRDNQFLLEKLIKIKEQKRHFSTGKDPTQIDLSSLDVSSRIDRSHNDLKRPHFHSSKSIPRQPKYYKPELFNLRQTKKQTNIKLDPLIL